MSAFKTFKGLYQQAQTLEDIAAQKGIKSEVKDQMRVVAKSIRELADSIEPMQVYAEHAYEYHFTEAPGEEEQPA